MTTITEDSILKNPLFPQNVDPLEISLFHFEKDISEADIDVNTKDKLRYVMRFVYDTLKELNIGFKDPLIQFVKKSLKYNNSLKNLQNYFTSIPSEKYFSNWTEIQKICYIIYYNLPYSRNFTNNNNLKNNISDITLKIDRCRRCSSLDLNDEIICSKNRNIFVDKIICKAPNSSW